MLMIQENVTVGNNGIIQLHTQGFKLNSKLSIFAIIEEKKRKKKKETALGILNKYADLNLKPLEKTAFADAIKEKYAID